MATYENNINNMVQNPNEEKVTEQTNETINNGVKMIGSIPEDSSLEWSPIPFKALGKTTRVHSDDLCRKIRAAFGESFHDLKGVNIVYINNAFMVEMFFEVNTEPLPDGKIRNLVNLTAPVTENKTNLYYKNMAVQHKLNGESFTLNDETKLLLSDFMFGGRKASIPNNKKNNNRWNECINEVRVPTSAYGDMLYRRSADRILVRVTGLDIKRILQKLYGTDMVVLTNSNGKTDENVHAKAFYEPRFAKMLPNGTFIINIEQFDVGAAQQFAIQENPQIQQQTGVVYYY